MISSKFARAVLILVATCVVSTLGVCLAPQGQAQAQAAASNKLDRNYRIATGDQLDIFVWRSPELSTKVPVRPDGKISMPLVEDIECTGKTPTELARLIEAKLTKYVTNPTVTVIVSSFSGSYDQEVRILGEAVQPKALMYKSDMTVLDALIDVGGLTRFAAGNRATLVRNVNGKQVQTNLKLDDLIKDGDISANVPLMPGDIIIVPQSYF